MSRTHVSLLAACLRTFTRKIEPYVRTDPSYISTVKEGQHQNREGIAWIAEEAVQLSTGITPVQLYYVMIVRGLN